MAVRCRFQRGDANKLDFPDECFDAVVSNYVYHNITGADKQALLLETLRALKKGGVFALNDEMKPRMYGDMEAFRAESCGPWAMRRCRSWSIPRGRSFGSHRRAAANDAGRFPIAGGAQVGQKDAPWVLFRHCALLFWRGATGC